MKKQMRILMAGVLVVAPFAVTIWAVWGLGQMLDSLVRDPVLKATQGKVDLFPGVGMLIVLAAVYLIGLLAQVWVFSWILTALEALMTRLPGIKTIYESVRDLLKLFGGDAKKMGQVVLYTPPGSTTTVLGVRTSPAGGGRGVSGRDTATVYLPFSYMFGGITVFAPPECLQEIDMPVETCLKLCATAFVTNTAPERQGGAGASERS
ncbi:MAG: DUF502 domain-containing protein [Planctomycetota bacterium]|nr:DUF502 domain-containing protein [Planctomycetota bacterium]